jgi:starch synthase
LAIGHHHASERKELLATVKVLFIAAECKPFSKVGGVGDVAGELPPALQRLGVDVEIVTPFYDSVKATGLKFESRFELRFQGRYETVEIFRGDLRGVPVNFVKNATWFGGEYGKPYIDSQGVPFADDAQRFSFFSEAILPLIDQKRPHAVHAHDWPLGYLFGLMAMRKMSPKRVLTVHNLGYQGNIDKTAIRTWAMARILDDVRVGPLFEDPRREWNSVNALRLGLELAHQLNTVSPTYMKEITQSEDPQRFFEGGKGLEAITGRLAQEGRLVGILNGFEYAAPPSAAGFAATLQQKAQMKATLARDFAEPGRFLLGFVGRAVQQKFQLLREELDGKSVLEHILDLPGVNLAVLGTGMAEYETFLKSLQDRPNASITIAFDRDKARQISLGSDLFLMPSMFEPCGITQMESLSCATPPLVRWTGGLVDTVRPHTAADGTGFGFDGRNRTEILRNLVHTVQDALALYRDNRPRFIELQRRGYFTRFLWSDSAERYIRELYGPALSFRK